MSRLSVCFALLAVLATACHRKPPEDPAEQVYRGAVQLFAQASAASHDLTYRDPRFDAVLAELAKVPEGSEFRPEAEALSSRIRTARETANAADAESQRAIEQALAQPAFQSQGKVEATEGSAVTTRTVKSASTAAVPPAPSGPGMALPPSGAAARAMRRSLPAGAQEEPDVADEPNSPLETEVQAEPVPVPEAAPRRGAPQAPPTPTAHPARTDLRFARPGRESDGHAPVILALDSATSSLSIALVEARADGLRTVLEREVLDGGKHGHRLPQVLEELLAEAGLSPRDLEACAVGLGPGSFTGLRVGLATMKGLCYARRIPLWGVSSLRAMAREGSQRWPAGQGETLYCPLLDARRGELYAGLYRGPSAERVAEETVLPPAALSEWLFDHGGSEAVIFGEGLHAHLEVLRSGLGGRLSLDPKGPRSPSAAVVAELARAVEPFRLEALFALEPHYLRPFTADPPRVKPASAGRRL